MQQTQKMGLERMPARGGSRGVGGQDRRRSGRGKDASKVWNDDGTRGKKSQISGDQEQPKDGWKQKESCAIRKGGDCMPAG